MRVTFRIVAVMGVLAGMSFLGPRVPGVTAEQTRPAVSPASPQGPDTAIERIRMIETQKGKRVWEVEADRAELFEDQGKAILIQVVDPVRIVIYNGEETLTSFAGKVIVDLKTKDLELIGSVRSESSQGTRIFTEFVSWSAGKRQISTDAPVVIEKEGYQIRGKGMVADTVLDQVTVHERIASEVTLSPEREQRR
ncbi:MAG: LPS export ABC transporter periplasmic protein LptC [Candidatus Methylomirabilales bacterium]